MISPLAGRDVGIGASLEPMAGMEGDLGIYAFHHSYEVKSIKLHLVLEYILGLSFPDSLCG